MVHVHRVHTGHEGDLHAQLGRQGANPDVQDMPQVRAGRPDVAGSGGGDKVPVLGREVGDAAHLPQVQGGHVGQSQKADGPNKNKAASIMGVVFGSQKNVTDYTSNDIVQNHGLG